MYCRYGIWFQQWCPEKIHISYLLQFQRFCFYIKKQKGTWKKKQIENVFTWW